MDLECDKAADQETMQLQELLDEHQGWLRRLVQSRIRDASTADDVLQEVGTAALTAANRPRDEDHFGPWLCRIALRQCAMAIRGVVRRRRLEQRLLQESDGQPGGAVDPIYWLIAEEEKNQIQNAMSQLDDDSRQILAWKYVDRLTYETIAKRLELSRHAAEYRVVRARKALRTALLDLGFEGEDRS